MQQPNGGDHRRAIKLMMRQILDQRQGGGLSGGLTGYAADDATSRWSDVFNVQCYSTFMLCFLAKRHNY